jgi:hypothetical protein
VLKPFQNPKITFSFGYLEWARPEIFAKISSVMMVFIILIGRLRRSARLALIT